jgi:hypothetical protein
MTDQELKEIEDRCNAATGGPWTSFIEGRTHESGDSFIMTGIAAGEDIFSKNRGADFYLTGTTNADNDFIAHARQDIPRLLDAVRQLHQQIETIKNNCG